MRLCIIGGFYANFAAYFNSGMLLTDFFTIKDFSINDNTGTVSVKINPEHKVFVGHFPGRPVVPGVFTLQMIKECVEVVLNRKFRYSELVNCKFSNVILPDKMPYLQIEYAVKEAEENIRLDAVVKSGDITALILKAVLTDATSAKE